MLHLERGQSLYSSAVKEYFFPHSVFPMFLFVVLAQTQRHVQAKSKQIYSGQVSFSLLTSCQNPPEEIPTPPERFTDTPWVEREGTAEWQSTAELLTQCRWR